MTSNHWNNGQPKQRGDKEKRQNGEVGTIRCQNEAIVSGEILFWLICRSNIANMSDGSIQCAV